MEHVTSQVTKFIESIHLLSQLQRREAAGTIVAATLAVAAAGGIYSFIQKALEDSGCKTVPSSSLLYGSTQEYRKDPQKFVEKWTEEFGPVFRAHLFGELMTVVGGQCVREVFYNNDFNFLHGMYKSFNVSLLLDLDMDPEKEHPLRRIVLKYLQNNVKAYTPRVVRKLQSASNEIIGDLSEEKIFPHAYPIMQHAIANASSSVFLGEKLAKDESLVDAFKNITLECAAEIPQDNWVYDRFTMLNTWRQRWIGKFSKRLQKRKSQLYNALKSEVEERLTGLETPGWERPQDILQDLIEDCIKNPPPIEMIQHLTDLTIHLIFASIHTTTEISTTVLYRLLQHPELIPELLEEQDQVLHSFLGEDVVKSTDDAATLFTYDVVHNLPKLDSLCRESIRLRNDYLIMSHKYIGKNKFTFSNGAVIKPGEYIIINSWYNHRAEEVQQDNTDDHFEFQPFRYANLPDRQATKIGSDYLIFGLGKNACPGRWFALQEIKTVVSFFIRQYEISNTNGIIFPNIHQKAMPLGNIVVKKRSS